MKRHPACLPATFDTGRLVGWRFRLFVSILFWMLFSCAEESNSDFERKRFTSVFDQNEFSAGFYPVDFKQTSDGGYLILAERKIHGSMFRGSYLLKVDQYGDFERDMSLDSQANPVGELMSAGGDYYFFAMDTLTLQGQVIKVDERVEAVEVRNAEGITYPAAARADGKTLLLLSYQHADKRSAISVHALTGEIVKGPASFSIGAGDDVEEPIMNHILRTGKTFPFQVGKLSDELYYFNGFNNYSFSVVFARLADNDATGVVQGQQDDGGLSAILPLGNGDFAISRFDFGTNYFLPRVSLATTGPTMAAHLGGYMLPELVDDSRVSILRVIADGKSVLVYAGNTKSKQIGLFFYDEDTGEFISSRYLGFSNPFEITSLVQTSDEGIAICGSTWLAGRFPRICLFKLSKEDVSKQVR